MRNNQVVGAIYDLADAAVIGQSNRVLREGKQQIALPQRRQ